MPNHVSHRFTVAAVTKEALDAFLEKVKDGDNPFSAQAILPMPENTRNTESGTDTTAGLAVLAAEKLLDTDEGMARRQLEKCPGLHHWWGDDPTDARKMIKAIKKSLPECVEKAKMAAKSLEETGCLTWYEWANRYWGTKWGMYESQVTRVSETEANVTFDTAWSPPTPILKKLAEENPGITFKGACIDEGWNFACKLGFENGVYYEDAVRCDANSEEFVEMHVAIYGNEPETYDEDE